MVRDARCYRQSGSDRPEKQPTDPAVAGRKKCYFGDRALTDEASHLAGSAYLIDSKGINSVWVAPLLRDR